MSKQLDKYPFYIIVQFAKLKLQEIFNPGKFLSEKNILSDPIQQFEQWYKQAIKDNVPFYEAMNVSTVDKDGKPSARMVLLKSFDERGFVFYSNDDSRKGFELADNPYAALTFFWSKIGKQVRVEGATEIIAMEEADHYFSTRPRGSQIAAWASQQSNVIASRDILKQRVKQYEKEFKGKAVPRPPHWIGYRLVPDKMEFWHNRYSRLHDRILFTRRGDHEWQIDRLAP